nr:hypothetical protein [Micromonospora sp. DSM 115978]
MPLPLPRPSAVFDLTRTAVDQAVGSAASFAAIPARAFGVLDGVEALLTRINAVVDRVEVMVDRVERVTAEAEEAVRAVTTATAAATVVVGEAELVAGQAAAAMARAEVTARTAEELLAAYETTLRKGAPMASRFVEQLTPEEVDAAIKLVDELPRLTEHVSADILPILATLDRVGPDIHDLLEVTRDLKLAVAGIPGLKMLRRRGEERLADNPS